MLIFIAVLVSSKSYFGVVVYQFSPSGWRNPCKFYPR